MVAEDKTSKQNMDTAKLKEKRHFFSLIALKHIAFFNAVQPQKPIIDQDMTTSDGGIIWNLEILKF